MKRRAVAIAVLAACTAAAIASAVTWRRRPWDLAPGDYRLSMASTRGSRHGHAASGPLTLTATSASDVSPRTGESADVSMLPGMPLYGWTDMDLGAVGAPLCDDVTPPSSRDPVHTGVLVLKLDLETERIDFRVPRRSGTPVLVMGTHTNIRIRQMRLDGCGIGFFVQDRSFRCLRGEWAEWGLKYDGGGTFELCPA